MRNYKKITKFDIILKITLIWYNNYFELNILQAEYDRMLYTIQNKY